MSDNDIEDPQMVPEEIERAAGLIMAPGEVYELRVPKAGRQKTISGYFSSVQSLVQSATALDEGSYPGIYITLNPVNPALLARAENRIISYAAYTTSDLDIRERRWLLIDCDPKRPAGISATDHEHGRAISTACGIWDDLHCEGFPDPVVCDSGNGCHLLYRIEAENSPENAQTIRALLQRVSLDLTPDDVDVDVSVFNASRVTKLYGTMTRKGDSTQDRPHRRSRILEIPVSLKAMDLEGIQ
jgi:hypothetical protein